MESLAPFLSLMHLIGLALGVGSATVKLILLFKCNADQTFVPTYLKVVRPVTRLIMVGTLLLILSGVSWLLLGYQFTSLLVVKLVLVGGVIVLGATIDKVFEPKFRKLAPTAGEEPLPEFGRIQKRYLGAELLADLLFYGIIVIWVLG